MPLIGPRASESYYVTPVPGTDGPSHLYDSESRQPAPGWTQTSPGLD